ncbi:MAG: (2Fe-2S) ferredoxin domain-containing protein [Candidatus Hydrogenedentes bacterium]|nr:(2Fe-2S) ferredoxin domain-containing protein [Candidatus Hydrogenedentota bacterium]
MGKRKTAQECVVFVCAGDSCSDRKSRKLYKRLVEGIEKRKLSGSVRCVRTDCMGRCEDGPNVIVCPGAIAVCGAKPKSADELLDGLLKSGVAPDSSEL